LENVESGPNETGEKWHTRRKQITPAFHFKILESYHEVFNTQSMVLVDILKDKQGKDEVCEMHGMFTRCALDIICETAMGKKLNCQRDLSHPYAIATTEESALVWKRQTSPWLHPDFIWKMSSVGRRETVCRKILHDFTEKVIQERKEEFLTNMRESGKSLVPENDESPFLSSKKKVRIFGFTHQYSSPGRNADDR
jgi:cytochrome P450